MMNFYAKICSVEICKHNMWNLILFKCSYIDVIYILYKCNVQLYKLCFDNVCTKFQQNWYFRKLTFFKFSEESIFIWTIHFLMKYLNFQNRAYLLEIFSSSSWSMILKFSKYSITKYYIINNEFVFKIGLNLWFQILKKEHFCTWHFTPLLPLQPGKRSKSTRLSHSH